MSFDFIKFAFIAGELSGKLHGRPDLEKFDLGLALARNWFVDYHGGISTRPGLEFGDWIKNDTENILIWPFKFNSNIANTYIVMFGTNYIRFIQDGAYVLENDVGPAVLSSASPAIATVAGHGLADNDWIKGDSRTYVVQNVTANTFEVYLPNGLPFDNTAGGTPSFATTQRIYTISSPYTSDDLETLRISQRKDILRLTKNGSPPRDLTRNDHTDWVLSDTVFGSLQSPPGGRVGAPITVGTYGFVWGVTSVSQDGVESGVSGLFMEQGTENFTTVAGGYIYLWNPVAGAKYYNVYRSNIVQDVDANRGQEIGFIGRVLGPKHSELNTVPDFTRTPPINNRLFEPGQIESVTMGAGGAGYDETSTVTAVGGGGSGFLGYPIVNASGAIIGVVVLNGGQGYNSAVTFSFTVGAGATATAVLGPSSGTYPAISARFQQREIYAASDNEPLTIWGSRPGQLNNFDTSTVVSDSDAYAHEIDAEEITPIRHIVSMRAGLLILSDAGIWQLTGGGVNDAVTPTNALADPHSYTGVNSLQPLRVDSDLIYQEANGTAVRMLAYNDISKVYAGTDVSILSSHLFRSDDQLSTWSYADSPFKLVWASRSDGAALAFTIVKEQNTFAWTQHWTRGYLLSNVSIREDNFDRTYFITQRLIDGRYSKFFERLDTRQFAHVEDAFCVDCGLRLGSESWPNGTLVATRGSGDLDIVVCSSLIFNDPRDLGKILRMSGGKAVVVNVSGDNTLTVNWLRPIDKFIPETTIPEIAEFGEWTLDTPVASVSGLWHLEGETVSILADGNVLEPQEVVNGTVTFAPLVTATRVIVGLPYRCAAKALPLTTSDATVEAMRKRLVAANLRLDEARGVKVGMELTNLYEVKERTNETYGEPNLLLSGMYKVPTQPRWDIDGSPYFVVDDPLPATILGFVLSGEIGDDPD